MLSIDSNLSVNETSHVLNVCKELAHESLSISANGIYFCDLSNHTKISEICWRICTTERMLCQI